MLQYPSIFDELNSKFWGDQAILEEFDNTPTILEELCDTPTIIEEEWTTVVRKTRNTINKDITKKTNLYHTKKSNSRKQNLRKSNSCSKLYNSEQQKCQTNQDFCKLNQSKKINSIRDNTDHVLSTGQTSTTDKTLTTEQTSTNEQTSTTEQISNTEQILNTDQTSTTDEFTLDKTLTTEQTSTTEEASTTDKTLTTEQTSTNEQTSTIEQISNTDQIFNIDQTSTTEKITSNNNCKRKKVKKTITSKNYLVLTGIIQNIISNGCGFIKSTNNTAENSIFMFLETDNFKIGDNVSFKIKKKINRKENQRFQRAFTPKLQT